MGTIDIKRATIGEVDLLQRLSTQTFLETFSAVNEEENMNLYVKESFSKEKLILEINDEHAEFYFAYSDMHLIGYLKINFGPSQTEMKDENSLEIERIYVVQKFHGKKVGQILFDQAIKIAKEKNADFVWLGVWEKNMRAINFYKKNGFVEFDKHAFMLGNDRQTDIMMKLGLGEILKKTE